MGSFEVGTDKFNRFFEELTGYRLLTSTYVLAETVRRLVKTKSPYNFIGPGGQKRADLAIHVLKEWISQNNVIVLCVPDDVFNSAKEEFRLHCGIQCDLTDIISWVIVQGLEQTQIVADDAHFRSLGLSCLPS